MFKLTTRLLAPATAFAAFLAIASAFPSLALGADVARDKAFAVETRDGVPRFTIDGVPVRSRIFFGLPGSVPIAVTPKYQRFEMDFFASQDARKKGTMHFRFGTLPGEIDLDNVKIVDKETGALIAGPFSFDSQDEFTKNWTAWHDVYKGERIATLGVEAGVGEDNSNGLKIVIEKQFANENPDFHLYVNQNLDIVAGRTYVVSFDVRSSVPRRLNVAFYRPDSPTFVSLGSFGRNVLENQVKLAAKAGVNFVSAQDRGSLWAKEDGTIDFSGLDATCDSILRANPNALLIPRLGLDPPVAWLNANPDAREVWHNAGHDVDGQGWDWASLSSDKYRKVANETLAAIVRHMEEKYGNSVAGYHPCGQNTNEWFTPNAWGAGDAGFAQADVDGFREWLTRKYADDSSLREAWNDPNVALATAEPPSSEERLAAREKPYLEPGKLLDFNDFWQTRTTDVIRELARTVKRETNGKKMTFFFYGYSYEFSSVTKGPAASSHYALRALLDCPDVDVVCSPISYGDRGLGEGCSCMLNAESVTAAGKVYLYEDDCRTYLAHALGERLASVETVDDSVNIVLRNSSETAERNFATWLMDLGAAGWYDSPEIWDAVAKLAPMDQYFLDHPTPYHPEIGLFLSERSMLRVTSGSYTVNGVGRERAMFNRVGAPYSQFDLADLLSGKAPLPKLTVVLNADALDAEENAALEKIEQSGKTKVARVGLKGLTTDEIRKLADEAGVLLYTDRPCNVWANGPFVTLHAPEDGDYAFRAPDDVVKIVDFMTGETVADGNSCKLALKRGDTRILRLER